MFPSEMLVVKGRVTLITWNSDKSPSLEFARKASKFDDVAIKVSGQYLFDKLVPIKNTKGPSVRQPCNGVYIGLVRENLIEHCRKRLGIRHDNTLDGMK
jgi:hypothetical protein